MQRITALWNRGLFGKVVISLVGLVIVCCVIGVLVPRQPQTGAPAAPVAQAPSAAITQPTEAPAATRVPRATREPLPTKAPEPTETLVPTFTPVPTIPHEVAGVKPLNKDDCPPDYSIKGNIGNNGKIYHLGDPSYAQTDPEICFATIADAVAAGFRAP